MHSFSKIFDLRKQSKKMDQTQSPKPKLVRRNAVKNFEYTPSHSTSASSSTGGSSAHRTRSLDLPNGLGRTSFRVEGNVGELDTVYQSLGLSGPEDFEIPKLAWEIMKKRSSSDVVQDTRRGIFNFDEPEEEHKEQEIHEFVDSLSPRFRREVHMDDVIETDSGVNEQKLFDAGVNEQKLFTAAVPELDGNVVDAVGIGGIKGDRPSLLTPPPPMSLPVRDDMCSTWELLKGLAPDDGGDCHLSLPGTPDLSFKEEGDREHALREGPIGVRIGETVLMSGCCSFTTNDDDSSSTTTEPASIVSPNGPNVGLRVSITHGHWEKGAPLGRGSFGTVFEGISSEGIFFAVKEVSLLQQGNQGIQSIFQLEQEIQLLSQFEHENIVRYFGTDKDDSNLYIFLELMTQGSIAILYNKYHLRDSHVSAYTRQILLGLKYLHDRNVVHRDIKCANILVASNGTIKLADFGLAKATRLNDLKSCKGTPFWMAPEVVNNKNQGYGLAADIWSLGCTVLEMLTGHVPYSPLEPHQALYRIGKGEPPALPDSLSRNARDLIQRCLQVNPNDRPTAADLLELPFVQRALHIPLGSDSPKMPGR